MSSEDDYYDVHDYHYEARPSNRSRRRGSTRTRRHKKRSNDYYTQKSRRFRAWYRQNSARLIAACMFILVLGYEFVMLRGPLIGTAQTKPLSSTTTPPSTASSPRMLRTRTEAESSASENMVSRRVAYTPPREPPPSSRPSPDPSPPLSAARAPVSSENGETTAERIKAALKPIKTEGDDPPAFKPLKKSRRSAIGTSVKAASHKEPVQASALTLESKAADADDEPDVSSITKKESPRSFERTADINSPVDRDIEPPRPGKHSKLRDGGSEPGEGENFWQWFQETKGKEGRAVGTNLNCPKDSKRLCQMFYKYLRKYKIRTVFDASCGTNLDWLPKVLEKAGNELWGFKFYCSISEDGKLATAKGKLSKLTFVEFITDQWWRDGYPEDTELLFAWDVLPHIAYGRVWNFFVKAKKQDIRYILIDNYPGILNDPVCHVTITILSLTILLQTH